MTSSVARYDDEGMRVLTFANGERNLLNPESMSQILEAITAADDDESVHAILLVTTGEVYCGGLDITAIRAGANPVDFAGALVSLLHVFPRLRKPIATAVQGDALAGGAALVAAVDYAVAVPLARIGSQEVAHGIWPMIAQVPLVHRIGVRHALENIGCGEPFTARRAQEVGLVQAVVAPDELMSSTKAWLTLAQRGAGAYSLGRPSLHEFANMPYDEALDAALDRFASMFKETR
jgi:enoyl-CoA hydratase/carnithine racemase